MIFPKTKNFSKLFAVGIILFFVFTFSLWSSEEDEREDFRGLFKLPHEVITKEELSAFDTLKNDPSIQTDKLIEEAVKLLNKYYSQFIGEKRIWEDKLRGGRYNIKSDPTAILAFIHDLQSKKAVPGKTRDSEILFRLHIDLANLYEKKQVYHKSIESYLQAFRYRNFDATEEYYLTDKRWNEISNSTEIQKKETHKKNLEEYKKKDLELKKAEDDFHVLESDIVKNKISSNESSTKKIEIQNQKKELKASLTQAQKTYDDTKKDNYTPYALQKRKEDANVLFKFAKIVKIVENENKERQKIINKTSTAGKGIFVLFDYKRNTDFFSYNQILEFAHKVDPENQEIVKSIAEESQMSGNKNKSLDYYLKFVNLLEKNGDTSDDVKQSFLKIAILYSDLKRNVQAIRFYEKFLEKENDPKKKALIELELAGFYEEKIGNFEKSAAHYLNWLEYSNGIDVSSLLFNESLELKTEKFSAYYGLSKLSRYEKNHEQEKENLYKAYDFFSELRKNVEEEETKKTNIQKELLQVKKDLLATTNDEILAKFRLLEIRLNEASDKTNIARTKYKKLKSVEVLSRLTELEEKERNLSKTRSLFEEIIQVGTEEDISRSVRNLTRLDHILRDGIYRAPASF